MDTNRYSFLLWQLIKNKAPCLFIGETGTGKSVTVQNYLKYLVTMDQKAYLILSLNFSSRTSSLDFQKNMKESVDTRLIRTVGPPSGKQLIIFIDDVGMPKVDKYETQQPVAFLKLLVEKRYYYTRDNKELIKLIDTNFICAGLPPSGGNNKIDPRFVALFSVFNITAESDAIQKIFTVILSNYFKDYNVDSEIVKSAFHEQIVFATNEAYSSIKERLPRTPIKFHYVFTMRDITKVFQGYTQFKASNYETKESLVKLWRNEVLRVFSDKLLSNNDKKIVKDIVEDNIKRNFSSEAEYAVVEPCLFGDFGKLKFDDDYDEEPEPEPEEEKKEPERFYTDLVSYEAVKTILDKSLDAYKNAGNQAMDLVFYTDAIEHLVRIHRIIRIDGGNALLIGVGGSGKQSLSKLSIFIAGYEFFSIKLTSKFDEKAVQKRAIARLIQEI